MWEKQSTEPPMGIPTLGPPLGCGKMFFVLERQNSRVT
jgi:hypothetical protein